MFKFFRREASSGAAEKLVARGKIDAAIKMYRRVLKANPGDSSTLNRVGDLLSRVDKYSEAIDLYRQTAELFVEQGFYVKAIAVYKKIHRLDPSHLDVYSKLADLYTLQGLHNDARTHYEVLVDYHERRNDLPAAIGFCRKLVDLQPQDPTHRTRLAELYERKGDSASVAKEYLEIARVMLGRGALEQATQVLERALAVNGGDPQFLFDAVRLISTEGHRDFAETFLAEAERMNRSAGRATLVEEVRARLAPLEAAEAAAAPPPAPAPVVAPRAGTPASRPPSQAPKELSLELDEDVYVLQPEDEEVELDPAAAAPRAPESADDVIGEIEVFVKYGFREKAFDRLGELLRAQPDDMRAHQMLIDLLLHEGSPRAIVDAANRMAAAATASGDDQAWRETRDRLQAAGFLVAGDAVRGAPADLVAESDEFDLLETGGHEPEPERPHAPPAPPAQEQIFDLLSSDLEAAAPPAAPRERRPAGADAEQESVDFVVVDDGEFADLAAEVEREIESGVVPHATEAEAPTVEEIVASFKQGVAENLSPEDYDTHYNLGIAYREMGLVDEAIGEFQIAVASRDYFIGCCSLLGLCFRDKGEIETAIEWYRRGLDQSGIHDQEKHALLYELGEAHEAAGDLESARKAFAAISVSDGGYRDVGERLAALG